MSKVSKYKIDFLLLKEEDSKCNSIATLKNLLSSDGEVSFGNQKIKVNKVDVSFKIATELVEDGKKERFFIVTIEKKFDEKNHEEIIHELTEVFKKLKQIIIDSGKVFKIATLWDDTAFYFSKLSYPHIYEVENLMRKLIYKFMLTKLGSEWYKNGIPEEFRGNISQREKDAANAYFESRLYNADFIHMNNFLFGKYKVDEQKINEKIKNAKKISDLTLQEIKQTIAEDNWTRYFQTIIEIEKFKEKWSKLYELRCKVAHNSLMTNGDYKEILKLSLEFKENLEKAISSIKTVKVLEEEKDELSQSAIASFQDASTVGNSFEISKYLSNRYLIQGAGINANYFSGISAEKLGLGTASDFISTSNMFKLPTAIGLTTASNFIDTGKMSNIGSVFSSGNIKIAKDFSPFLLSQKNCTKCGKTFTPTSVSSGIVQDVCDDCKEDGIFLTTSGKK